MGGIGFDWGKGFYFPCEVGTICADMTKACHDMLHAKSGAGNDFLGWVDLPVAYDKEEFARIKKAAAKIQSDSDVLVVIGDRRVVPRRTRGH